MPLSAWILLVGVILLILEGRRQRRKYGKGSGRGASLLGTGLLEFQNVLEPERKIEVLREAERKRDLLVDISDLGDGEKPRAESE